MQSAPFDAVVHAAIASFWRLVFEPSRQIGPGRLWVQPRSTMRTNRNRLSSKFARLPAAVWMKYRVWRQKSAIMAPPRSQAELRMVPVDGDSPRASEIPWEP